VTKRKHKPGDVVRIEGKGKKKFTLKAEYQYRTVDGWFMRDEEQRHRVFPTSMIVT
jgi:hypothetical protein